MGRPASSGQVAPFLRLRGRQPGDPGQQPGLDGADEALDFLRDIGKHFRVNR